MRRLPILIVFTVLLFAWFWWDISLQATLKHKKETGKKCTFCHTRVPEQGESDPQLNEEGEKFKNNGFQLTEDQKRKPG